MLTIAFYANIWIACGEEMTLDAGWNHFESRTCDASEINGTFKLPVVARLALILDDTQIINSINFHYPNPVPYEDLKSASRRLTFLCLYSRFRSLSWTRDPTGRWGLFARITMWSCCATVCSWWVGASLDISNFNVKLYFSNFAISSTAQY